MIKRLTLINFQSHKETSIDFSDGVNALVGRSDVGKSAIERAMIWVIKNRPSGDAFRSHWGGNTSVEIETETHRIRRIKGDKINRYEIDDLNSTETKKFEAMGQGVPEVIRDLLNISDLNISEQHDGPFLLADSPGDIAKSLNEAVNLTIIDSATKKIRKRLTDATGDAKRAAGEIEDLTEELSHFDYIDDLEKDLAAIEVLRLFYNQVKGQASALAEILASALIQQNKIDTSAKMADLGSLLDDVTKKHLFLDSMRGEEESLHDMIDEITRFQKQIDRAAKTIEEESAEFERLMPDLCPLCEKG